MTPLDYAKNVVLATGVILTLGSLGSQFENASSNVPYDGRTPEDTLVSRILAVSRSAHYDCDFDMTSTDCTKGFVYTHVKPLSESDPRNVLSEDTREDIASVIEPGYVSSVGLGLIVLGAVPLYFSKRDNWFKRLAEAVKD